MERREKRPKNWDLGHWVLGRNESAMEPEEASQAGGARACVHACVCVCMHVCPRGHRRACFKGRRAQPIKCSGKGSYDED